jgi:hypothetical protein
LSGQHHERIFFLKSHTSKNSTLKKCLNAVLATNVVALLHHLMEGTYVPFAINSFMDLVVFLMGMIQLLPFAIDAFLALVQLNSLLF